jgi:hypothetical protein
VFGGTVNFAARVVGAIRGAEIWPSELLIPSRLGVAYCFFGRAENAFQKLDPVGFLIVTGDDDLGLERQDLLSQDFHDRAGFGHVAPAAIQDVVVPLKSYVASEKHTPAQ